MKSRLSDPEGGLWRELSEILKELNTAMSQPTPDQLERYAALKAEGFEAQTVKLAAIQCHQSNRTRFEEMEWMLKRWGEQGLYAHEAAEAYIRDMSLRAERVRKVLERCGLERRPTMNYLSLYEKWKQDYDDSVIDYAAECARGTRLPMRYADKLLEQWRKAGVSTVEAARAEREAIHAAGASGSTSAPPVNPALNYEQREYSEKDFGDDFFFDVVKAYGTGEHKDDEE